MEISIFSTYRNHKNEAEQGAAPNPCPTGRFDEAELTLYRDDTDAASATLLPASVPSLRFLAIHAPLPGQG